MTGEGTSRVALNTFFLATADIGNKILMFFFYVLVARHLGAEKFGILSFAFAFVTMFSALTDLGLGAVSAREIARNPASARYHIHNALGIKLIAAGVVTVVIVFLVNILGYAPVTKRVVYICSLFVIETAFTAYFCYIFQGFQRMEFVTLMRCFQGVILLIGAGIMSQGLPVVERYAWLYASAGLGTTVVGGVIMGAKFVPLGIRFVFPEWRQLLRTALPVGLGALFVLFYYWNGSTILAKITGDRAVGFYNAAFRLVVGLNFFAISFSGALYPVLAKSFPTGDGQLERIISRALKLMLIILLPIGVLGMIFSQPLIVLIYGTDYQPAASVLKILVWWAVFAGFTSLFSNYFIAINQSRLMTVQTGIALFTNVLLNFVLIPQLGAAGAAIAILAAEFGGLIFYLAVAILKFPRRINFVLLRTAVIKGGVAIGIAAILARIGSLLSPFAGAGLGMVSYLGFLIVFKLIDSKEFSLLGRFFRGRR